MALENLTAYNPERHKQLPVEKDYINYFKLYLVIVAAILSSAFIIFLLSSTLTYFAFKDFELYMSKVFNTPAQTQYKAQHSSGLQSDLNKLNQAATSFVSKPIKTVSAAKKQKLAARKNDLEICKFWTTQYKKDKSASSRMHRDTSCKRANQY